VVNGKQARWIVLINRAPYGPLVAEEIKTLLSEGMIRANDVAYQVPETGEKSSWKFLWQFPEFERRKEPRDPESKPSVTVPLEERRKAEPAPISPIHTPDKLPEDLFYITPEDLILRARTLSNVPGKNSDDLERSTEDLDGWKLKNVDTVRASRPVNPWALALAGGSLILGVVVASSIFSTVPKVEMPTVDTVERVPSPSVSRMPTAPAITPRSPANNPVLPPSNPTRGLPSAPPPVPNEIPVSVDFEIRDDRGEENAELGEGEEGTEQPRAERVEPTLRPGRLPNGTMPNFPRTTKGMMRSPSLDSDELPNSNEERVEPTETPTESPD
jgi:hypothetical protein